MNYSPQRTATVLSTSNFARPCEAHGAIFLPTYEKPRQPRKSALKLSELAAYVSVYEVDAAMIDELEALLVRGFANDLLNARMERFAGQKKRRAGKSRKAPSRNRK